MNSNSNKNGGKEDLSLSMLSLSVDKLRRAPPSSLGLLLSLLNSIPLSFWPTYVDDDVIESVFVDW